MIVEKSIQFYTILCAPWGAMEKLREITAGPKNMSMPMQQHVEVKKDKF